jgi:spore maturation protein CgeB
MKTIYYVALKWDYAEPAKGHSFEYDNMECGMVEWAQNRADIRLEIFHQDVPSDIERLKLAPLADDIFHVGFTESYDLPLSVALKHIQAGKKVWSWDCDSSYRFYNWILPRRDRYTHFITTHSSMYNVYKAHGMNVIKSQWGAAPSHYYMPEAQKKYDVSFIGQCHGIRPQIMRALYDAGIEVHLFGDYWDHYPNYHGRLQSIEQVVRVFNESKINLNLQNPWQPGTPTQIKARFIQIPSCGAFQIATHADDVENYFINNIETVVVNDMPTLIDKIKYYLENEKEREEIAAAGYNRMLAEHQWSHRFEKIFSEIV